jgi:hypothetical protein
MDVEIRLTDGKFDDLASLGRWLGEESELRGKVRWGPAPIKDTELGGVTDLLAVAVGAGGAATMLAQSLKIWLETRRTTAKLTLTAEGRSITIEISTVKDAMPMLQQVLQATDEH